MVGKSDYVKEGVKTDLREKTKVIFPENLTIYSILIQFDINMLLLSRYPNRLTSCVDNRIT